ncbi:DUF5067 domain-containing protein [Anaerococcus sp. AGMB00486]|uniref:DUF5067 domain-containing protein n=2 Tax=Anaerococcus TaxID=165779 RepID=A0ABX2N9N2_9FIRM|nr:MULTISPECIES: DUF5067 domain-containing protein [Anaerococcus]MDY3005636.1 DUF5067 domain-containing protein [Anaerococcus porci]MSS78307.1 DUF5067 domain-containing protein [Anaerococcus porci]NVF11420.1 DUF5067 domain-containing protein [Anaerococcus faecalis]
MKKKILISLGFIVLIFSYIFLYQRANAGYPSKSKIEEYSYKDNIDLGDIEVKIYNRKIENFGGRKALRVDIEYMNQKNDMNIVQLGYAFSLYQDFSSCIVQNIRESEKQELIFEPTYNLKDLNIKKGEKKRYAFYYWIEDKGDYKNALLISINTYLDQYKKEYKKGNLYYKTIDLGDVYD